jgi:hypothetical protein
MSVRKLTVGLLTSALALTLAPLQVSAQSGFTPAKNSFGQPDISGTWTNETLTPMQRAAEYGERLVLSEEEVATLESERARERAAGDAPTDPRLTVEDLPFSCGGGFTGTNCGYNSGWTDSGDLIMRVGGEPRTSFITTTENGRVPPRLDGAGGGFGRGGGGRGGVERDANPETFSMAERCLTSFGNSAGPVMLPLLYNNNYRIVQGKDSVAIWVEMVHDVRVVNIGAEHRTDGVRPWWGDSIGWYDGNTLVVETTNYPQQNSFQGAWEDLKVTEKFTPTAQGNLLYQFTVASPSTWAEPWGGEYEFTRSGGIYEYACHEGNYALEGMLAGARQEEADAAAAAGEPQAAAPGSSAVR